MTLGEAVEGLRVLVAEREAAGLPPVHAIRVTPALFAALRAEAGGSSRVTGGNLLGIPLIVADVGAPLIIVALA